MSNVNGLRLYFVVGEESGDALGASLLEAFETLGQPVEAMGLAGHRMQEKGINSLFDISDISVMGISGVFAQLPKLYKRIRLTVRDIIAKKPDVLLLIDSPEFSYRVAQRVRKQLPHVKIVKYVAPSVWAWRPKRAKKIKPYIDHILAILPFEPNLLRTLGGPDATYVGHPLAADMPDIDTQMRETCSSYPKLLLLPGSRHSETKRLLPFIGETLEILKQRDNRFEITLLAVGKLRTEIETHVNQWPYEVRIVSGDVAKSEAFIEADLAMAASGTATLELALYKVPMISIYKLDGMAMMIRHLLTGWTASLPNLVADYPVVPERFNEYAHPHYVARMIERLCLNNHERQLQLKGFEIIRKRLEQETPSYVIAAEQIMKVAGIDRSD